MHAHGLESRTTSTLLDRVAIALSGACLIHCVATVVLIGVSTGAVAWLTDPRIHETGLLLAMLLAAVALVGGVVRHRSPRPLLIGGIGLAAMTLALVRPHGLGEVGFTVIGVSLLATAHLMNRRRLS